MGRLFDALTDTDKRMAEYYINRYSGETMSAPLEHILRFWDKEKEPIFDMFGGKLILEKEIHFERSQEQISEEMENKCSTHSNNADPVVQNFISSFRETVIEPVYRQCRSIHWAEREEYERKSGNIMADSGLDNLFNCYKLAKNVVEQPFEFTNEQTGEVIKVCKGAKITKTIGRIAKIYGLDMDAFERFRIVHSQVLNQKRLSGHLCLSIHPLDYMTMSDNNCGWSSCMSWDEEGCYRQGTVEMMNSPMVVVAYLTSENGALNMCWNYELGAYDKWNSKKWRQLFVINKDIITNVKAYPYRNDDLTRICLDWLKELAVDYTYLDNIQGWEENDPVVGDHKVRIYGYTEYMYNDIENSNGLFCYLNPNLGERYDFNYSGETECMCCGEVFDACEEVRLVCYDCQPGYCCEECGDALPDEDYRYWLDDVCYCEYCYNRFAMEDSVTGDCHHKEDMHEVHIGWKIGNKRGMWIMDEPLIVWYDNGDWVYRRFWDESQPECENIKNLNSYDYFGELTKLTDEAVRAFDFGDKYELYEYLRTEAEYIGDPLPDSIKQLISQVDPNKASKE